MSFRMIIQNLNIVKSKNCVIWIQALNIYKRDIYKDISEDIEARFDTSNYELDRPQTKGKNKKVI